MWASPYLVGGPLNQRLPKCRCCPIMTDSGSTGFRKEGVMTAKNDGTALESVVELIEGMRLQPGFTIEKRRKVFNEDGVQIVEFDIIISGMVGSTTCPTPSTMLIECRDRPSGTS